jgi:hypothetical protein
MNPIPDEEWRGVEPRLVAEIKRRLLSTERVQFTTDELLEPSGVSASDARAVLDNLVEHGFLRVIPSRPCPSCKVELSSDDIEGERCGCGFEFEEGKLPREVRVYVRDGRTFRDIRWAVAIHGMNTPGNWQQDVSWRLAQMYGYSIPFGIYKYGDIKLSPLMQPRQRLHRNQLLAYMKKLRDEMVMAGKGERPDVIAHSFGTWLISEALRSDTSNQRLRIGRIILTGSIVRPDFDWSKLIREDCVEAVLCHRALRDFPVRMAHYTIPHAGPSGTKGFNDRTNILHVDAPEFGHSDYFLESNLKSVMDSVWKPFLQRSLDNPATPRYDANNRPPWRPSVFRYVTHSLKWMLLTLLAALAFRLLWAMWIGLKGIGLF